MKPDQWKITGNFTEKLLLLLAGIGLYLLIDRWSTVWGTCSLLLGILSPFFGGIGLAYLLDIAVRALEQRGLKRPLAVLISVLAAGLALALLITWILPDIIQSLRQLVRSAPGYYDSLTELVQQLSERIGLPENPILQSMEAYRGDISNLSSLIVDAARRLPSHMGQVMAYSRALGTGIVRLLTAVFFAVYMLLDKNRLLGQLRKLAWSFLNRRQVRRLFSLCGLTNRMCKGFFEGKCIDSLVIGLLNLILMSVLQLPFAGLVSLVVGVTNVVPIVGPIVGGAIGFLLIVMESHTKGFIFLLMILILQQTDGKVIGPYILGDRVGLPTLWVLVALMVGGAVGGALGMVLGVPLMATLYTLLREKMNRRANAYHASKIAVRLVDEPDEPDMENAGNMTGENKN